MLLVTLHLALNFRIVWRYLVRPREPPDSFDESRAAATLDLDENEEGVLACNLNAVARILGLTQADVRSGLSCERKPTRAACGTLAVRAGIA